MWWPRPNVGRLAARGDRRGLVRALTTRDRERRAAAAEALLTDGLSVAEVEALAPALDELAVAETAAGQALAVRLVTAFGQARWRAALPVLDRIHRDDGRPDTLNAAALEALEAIQPGLTDPRCQAPDSPRELKPCVVMERGRLAPGGVLALRGYLERMPLCGVVSTAKMSRTPREEGLRAHRLRFRDQRLERDADFSGTRDETARAIIEGLYRIAKELGEKNEVSGRSAIRPCWREGVPGLSEVRTQFGLELAYEDLVARGDRDWFYYWGTEH